MTPNTHPELFRAITLGTATSPGTVTLSGHDRDASWDVAEAKGQKGASSTLNGDSVGQFQASFFLASPADQIAWPAFQRVVESTLNVRPPKALPIYHPDLAANHFTEVCAKSIGGIVRDERGGATVLVTFIEYRPPKAAAAKSANGGGGSTPGAGDASGGDGYDPNAERKRELDKLMNEAANA
ncbi:MAG: hypothetical protein WCT23_10165 [Candidatus Neomarinimicrobiota bacterium]